MIDILNGKMGKQKLIVQIPAYNEEKTIANVIKAIPRKIKGISNVKIIVLDDCSRDNTSELAKKAGADHIFRNKSNKGLGTTFKKGIEICLGLGADIIINIDGDGQFNPNEIPKLLHPLLTNGADMVTGSRFMRGSIVQGIPRSKVWGNKRFSRLISRITKQRFTDTQCGFRAYSREAALKLTLNGKFTYTQEVFIDLIEKGMNIKEVPIHVRYFRERKSLISGNLRRYGFKTLGIIAKTTRDSQPLTFFGLPALVIFGLGFLGGLASLVYWMIHHATSPIQTLFNVSVFFMIFGVVLGILALIADMLKTIKLKQDEILYRLKRSEFERG
jgi:glycosyltransferase involved in cell wall biosynthesis